MTKDSLLKLTLALYRVTELFPEKEPLKFEIRKKALEILTDLLSTNPNISEDREKIIQLKKNLEVLNCYFEIAKAQNWLDPGNFLVLSLEYDKIRKSLIQPSQGESSANYPRVRPRQTLPPTAGLGMNERQEKILEFLRERGKAQVWQVKEIFPEVSKRTLRRDFKNLLKKGIIERMGEKNETFYRLPTNYESKRITNEGRTMS